MSRRAARDVRQVRGERRATRARVSSRRSCTERSTIATASRTHHDIRSNRRRALAAVREAEASCNRSEQASNEHGRGHQQKRSGKRRLRRGCEHAPLSGRHDGSRAATEAHAAAAAGLGAASQLSSSSSASSGIASNEGEPRGKESERGRSRGLAVGESRDEAAHLTSRSNQKQSEAIRSNQK